MAHSVCPDDQAQRWEEGLYGTLCVCFALSCDRRTAAGPQQGHALDASRKLTRRAAFSAVSFCNGVVGCCTAVSVLSIHPRCVRVRLAKP